MHYLTGAELPYPGPQPMGVAQTDPKCLLDIEIFRDKILAKEWEMVTWPTYHVVHLVT